jgi:pimeloyl-ACP methyl ester carboxylesterase
MTPAYPALPAAVSGERIVFDSPAGRLAMYVAGDGPPLLLVHSVNAAASAAEVRPLHEHYRRSRTVFTPDLPGFGHSVRDPGPYTPRRMTDALHAVLAQVRARCGPAPVDALACSLSSEFLARAAVEAPHTLRSLALVSPTGFRGSRALRRPEGSTLEVPGMHAVLRGPGWGGALFRGLTRPAVIRFFLEKTFGSRTIDEPMWSYAVATARQPGSEHAPLQFLCARLFSADIHTIYERLTMPVWMSHGVRGDFTDYRQKRLVEGRPNWRFTVFDSGALPFFENGEAFFTAWDAFLGTVSAA